MKIKEKDIELELEKHHILLKNWMFEELEKQREHFEKKMEDFQKRQDKIIVTFIILLLCLREPF